MDLLGILQVSASGLSAERTRLQTVSTNIANARTTRTDEGGPYRRQMPVLRAAPVSQDPFADALEAKLQAPVVADIALDPRDPELVYDPGHPDADPQTGLVAMPNVNVVEEMVDMISASRAYEANVTAISATKNMALKALEIGR
jgi:flagellar basal-body rod protein FlgC